MGVGDPSYTSGAHIWKGTLAILKPKPATISTTPNSSALPEPPALTCAAMPASDVVPVNPYTSTMPYSSTAELTALNTRNFIPDSLERLSRENAASAAMGSAVSSSAT